MVIPDWATVLVVANYFVTQQFLAFPVVSSSGELIGQVDVRVFTDEVVGHAKRSFDDISQIIGVHATQGRTVWLGFHDRFPWLLTNVTGGGCCCRRCCTLVNLTRRLRPDQSCWPSRMCARC